MEGAVYAFAQIHDIATQKLRTATLKCGKKRAADEDIDEVGGAEKKVKVAGPVKIDREAAAKYWQSLIDAGKGHGIGKAEKKKKAGRSIASNIQVEVRVKKNLAVDDKATTSLAKIPAPSPPVPTLSQISNQFDCADCKKKFMTKTALGQHTAAKHGATKRPV